MRHALRFPLAATVIPNNWLIDLIGSKELPTQIDKE